MEWFNWNFEDPANETPYESAEGGYIYIWGGPHNALDELSDRFDGVVSQETIEQSVESIERHGHYDWAPSGRRIGEEGDEESDGEDGEEPPPLTPGTSVDEIRKEIADRLSAVELALNAIPRNSLIGHNHPPEAIDEAPLSTGAEDNLRRLVAETAREIASPVPTVSTIAKQSAAFRAAAQTVLGWLARHAKLRADPRS